MTTSTTGTLLDHRLVPAEATMRDACPTMTITRETARWLLVGAFLVALGVRVAVTAAFQGLDAPPNLGANPDQAEYEQITYNLSLGHGYSMNGTVPTAVRPPGFALTLLPLYELFGRSYVVARAYLILLSSLTCLFVAWAAYQWGGRVPAVLAAWWLALYPGHFYYSMHFLSEPVYAFWLSAALASTIAGMRSDRRLVDTLAGLAWALAILTRVELIVVVPIAWGLTWYQERDARRRCIRHLLVQTLVIAALVGPWVARNAIVLHRATLSTQSGCTFWGSHNAVTFTSQRFAGSWVNCSDLVDATHPMGGSEIARDQLTMGYGAESVRRYASRIPYLVAMKIWRLTSPLFETPNRTSLLALALGWIVAAPFVFLGVWSMWKRDAATRHIWWIFVSPLVATLLTTVIFYGSTRYRDAVSPILMVFAAFGLIDSARLLSRQAVSHRS